MIENMQPQIAVDVTEATRKVLSMNTDSDESSRINEVCERYLNIVNHDMLSLPMDEWMALIDCLDSTIRDPVLIRNLELVVRDAIDMEGLAERWELDGDDLCNRLAAMTIGQKTAIIEIVDRYWSEYGGKSVELTEALKSIGAKIAD